MCPILVPIHLSLEPDANIDIVWHALIVFVSLSCSASIHSLCRTKSDGKWLASSPVSAPWVLIRLNGWQLSSSVLWPRWGKQGNHLSVQKHRCSWLVFIYQDKWALNCVSILIRLESRRDAGAHMCVDLFLHVPEHTGNCFQCIILLSYEIWWHPMCLISN